MNGDEIQGLLCAIAVCGLAFIYLMGFIYGCLGRSDELQYNPPFWVILVVFLAIGSSVVIVLLALLGLI